MTTPNFRRTPTPAPGAKDLALPPEGMPPLKSGRPYVSDSTRKMLEPFGYRDGDPIHPGLSKLIAEARAEISQGDATHAEATRAAAPTAVRSELIPLTALSPERQMEIRQLLETAKQIDAADVQQPANLNPSVLQATQQLQARQTVASPNVVDDLSPPAAGPNFSRSAAMPPPPPSPPAPPAAAPLDEDPPPHTHAGTFMPHQLCPRCNWNMQHDFTAQATDEDRQSFFVAMLGLQRFTKMVPLMNSAITVTFRTLTAKESVLAFEQLSYDQQETPMTTAEYYMALINYRMCMSIESVRASEKVILQVPPIFEIPYDPPPGNTKITPLVELQKWITETGITQEPLRRAIGQQHRQFQRLVETLEAQTAEPSFWQGIVPQL